VDLPLTPTASSSFIRSPIAQQSSGPVLAQHMGNFQSSFGDSENTYGEITSTGRGGSGNIRSLPARNDAHLVNGRVKPRRLEPKEGKVHFLLPTGRCGREHSRSPSQDEPSLDDDEVDSEAPLDLSPSKVQFLLPTGRGGRLKKSRNDKGRMAKVRPPTPGVSRRGSAESLVFQLEQRGDGNDQELVYAADNARSDDLDSFDSSGNGTMVPSLLEPGTSAVELS